MQTQVAVIKARALKLFTNNSNDEAVKKVVRLENSVAKNKNEPQSNDILDLILAELVVGKTVPRSKNLLSIFTQD